MQKWQTTLLMVVAGVVPVAVAIVSLQQFQLIGLDTALLLGLLYLLFISTNVWCRVFTRIPPSSNEQQVDSLPCYDETVKAEPPPYDVLFPRDPPSYDVTIACTIQPTVATPSCNKASPNTSTSATPACVNLFQNTSLTFNPTTDETGDRLPILGKQNEEDLKRTTSKPILVSSQVSGARPQTLESPSLPPPPPPYEGPPEEEERQVKKDTIYSRMLENIASPLDYV